MIKVNILSYRIIILIVLSFIIIYNWFIITINIAVINQAQFEQVFLNLFRNQMEAETQFDLDDILCSNYTQTTGEEDGKY